MLAAVLCFEVIAVSVAIAGINGAVEGAVTGIAIFASLFGFFGCIGALIVALTAGQGPEKGIESELRRALSKNTPQHD